MQRYYAVIFDAGSGGTRPYIYRITPRLVDGGGNVTQLGHAVGVVTNTGADLQPAEPGIHNSIDPAPLAAYLAPLFNQVTAILGALPPLPALYYLYATGGVQDRLTPAQQVTLAASVALYFNARGINNADRYRVITGPEEAKFGWVAANRSLARLFDAAYVEMGGATAQIALPLRPANAVIAAQVEAQIGNAAVARVEVVGAQQVFFASYPLGTKAGYDAYIAALTTQPLPSPPPLAPGDLELTAIENGTTIFFDPSKPVGQPDQQVPNGTIRARPTGPAVGQDWPRAESNLAKTLRLVGQAIAAFPHSEATRPLDATLQNYHFIGASNFWWTMCQTLSVEGTLDLSTFQKRIKAASGLSFAEIQAKYPTATPGQLERYCKATFTARWSLQTLRSAFGLQMDTRPGFGGQQITFAPYNGGGADRNRFSWTLGVAVLLASPGLNDLEPLLIRAP